MAWDSIRKGKWKGPLIGIFASIFFDALTIFFLFGAFGNPVSVNVLIAGYGLPLLFGKIAFIFPGGLGVIESSMTALYTHLGVHLPVSTIVVLAYRLYSFWIPLIIGFFIIPILNSKNLTDK